MRAFGSPRGETPSRNAPVARFRRFGQAHPEGTLSRPTAARAPLGEPQQPLDRGNVAKGIWNVMPDIRTNHSYFQGGYFKRDDPMPFFQDLMELLASLK